MKATVVETLVRRCEVEVSVEEFNALAGSFNLNRELAQHVDAMSERVKARFAPILAETPVETLKLVVESHGHRLIEE